MSDELTPLQATEEVAEEEQPHEQPDLEQLDYLLEEVRKSLDAQWQQWDNLEARVRFLLTLITAAITLAITLVVGKSGQAVTLPSWSAEFLGLAGTAIVGSLVFLVWAYWPRNFYRPPDPMPLSQQYLFTPIIETKITMLDTTAAAYQLNQERLDANWFRFKVAFWFTNAASILALISLLIGFGVPVSTALVIGLGLPIAIGGIIGVGTMKGVLK